MLRASVGSGKICGEGVARFMGVQAKRALVWVAVFAIAFQGIAAPFGLSAAQAANIDPFTVICHNGAPDMGTPGSQQGLPTQSCDHCILCHASPASNVPDQISTFALPALRSDRRPELKSIMLLSTPCASSHLARGPPQTV